MLAGSKNSLSVAGPTAVRFGRGWSDRRSVYVSLSGGSTQYLTGNLTNGGGIVRVDVGGFL